MSQFKSISIEPVENPGSAYYNAYYYLSLFTDLYARIAEVDYSKDRSNDLLELAESLMEDLGLVYEQWESGMKGKPVHEVGQSESEFVHRTICRAEVIHNNFSMWTPVGKSLITLKVFEQRWQRVIQALMPDDGLPNDFTAILSHSKDRLQKLMGVLKNYDEKATQMVANYRA